MRRILFIIVLMFTAISVSSQSTLVDCYYRKVFDIKTMHIDYNQDYEAQEGEVVHFPSDTNAKIYIEYEDYKDNGNSMYYEIIINNGKKCKKFSDTIKDVIFMKNNDRYAIGNKFSELQMGVSKCDDEWILFISNPSLLIK